MIAAERVDAIRLALDDAYEQATELQDALDDGVDLGPGADGFDAFRLRCDLSEALDSLPVLDEGVIR